LFAKPSDDALLVTRWGVNLVVLDDLPWLVACLLRIESSGEREKIAYLLRFIFYPDNVSRIELIIDAAKRCQELRHILDFWFDPIILEYERGKKLKTDWDQEQELKRISAEHRKEPPPPDPPPVQRISNFLNLFEGGDLDAWWQICFWLGIEDNGRYSQKDYCI